MANENTQAQAGLFLDNGNKNQNRYLNYYNQISTQLMENPNKISYTPINVGEQTYEGLAQQISAYLRPYTENAIRQRRTQTASDRSAADVDAYSRGMGASTWLSDAKNRMAAAEAADIASLESSYQSNLMNQVYNSYQDYLNRQYNAAVQNAQNQLATDQFNAQLYQTLEERAWNLANQLNSMKRSGSGNTGGGVTVLDGGSDRIKKNTGGIVGNVTGGSGGSSPPTFRQYKPSSANKG